MFSLWSKLIFLTILSYGYGQNLQSPCPGLFSYDPEVQNDRWSGTLTITPDTEYSGLWIRVIFDRPILELITNFGEVVKREENEFLIKKPQQIFQAGVSQDIRVTVKYQGGTPTPKFLGYRVNGRVVCPVNGHIETTNLMTNLISPCPTLFSYETQNSEADRWYGVIELQSDQQLSGVWLRIILDRPSVQLGVRNENWFGEVTTDDNQEYLIKNRNTKLTPGEIVPIRFFVKYNPTEKVPKLERFRLNARDVCPDPKNNIPTRVLITTESSVGTPGWVQPDPGQKPDPSIFGSDFDPNSRPTFLPGRGSQSKYPCGVVAAQPRPLITHGQPTSEGQYPWHAALYNQKGIDLQYICGASLISLKHVLSAGHCVTKKSTNIPVQNNDIEVYLGKYNLRKFTGKAIQHAQVASIQLHPDYNHRYYENDIAVLTLTANIDYTDYVRPVCIWKDDTEITNLIDKPGTVVGWGYDHTGKVTESLTKAQMPVVSQLTCIRSYPEFFSKFAHEKTLCAGYRNGTSVCNGDSGGGLVFPKSESNPGSPEWQIRGVVSLSVALQSEFICDTSHYTIFTDVAKYLAWIRGIIN